MAALLDRYQTDILPLKAPNTQSTYGHSLTALRAYFCGVLDNPRVEVLHSGHIREYLTWRRTPQVEPRAVRGRRTALSNRTVEKERAVLHSVFAFAKELHLRADNPVADVPPPAVDTRAPVLLTDDQFEALLAACDQETRPMLWLYVLTLGETGARCESEVLWVRWEDVDLEEGFLLIESGRDGHRVKSGKRRSVPLYPRLRQALREHFARFRFASYDGIRTPWVFHHDQNRRHAKAGERLKSLRGGFDRAVQRAGLPLELHQHDLRHRRVTKWLAEGANPVLVKEAVGHSDLRTTMGYTHLAREHLRALITSQPGSEVRQGRGSSS